MSNFLDSLQVELIFSLIIMVVMAIFFIYAGKKFATADPTARPKGVVLVVETGVKMIYDYLKSIMPKKFEELLSILCNALCIFDHCQLKWIIRI